MKEKLLEAIDLALSGEWDVAHSMVQEYDDDATAAWIHAVLHRFEWDQNNCRYWYNRADKLDHLQTNQGRSWQILGRKLPQ